MLKYTHIIFEGYPMQLHEIYLYDKGLLLNKKTNQPYYNLDRDGYVRVRKDGKEYRAHRLIWEMHYGPIPANMLIDHIDGNTLNNKIENLRIATRQQNNSNSIGKLPDRSLPKGVTLVSSRYRARITFKGKTISLGTFATIEEAKAAYDIKNIELNKEFARA